MIRLSRIRKYVVRRFLRPVVFRFFRSRIHPDDPTGTRWQFYGFFRVVPENGNPFWLYNNSFKIETGIFWAGLDGFDWEPMTRRIWTAMSRNATTILDIGANTGVFAMMAQSVNPDAQIVAFEPQPNIHAVLAKNGRRNGNRVRCEQLALADKGGVLPFYNSGKDTFRTRNTTAGSLNSAWHPNGAESIDVTVETLSHYLENGAIQRVDLIKIDVETFEYEVLVGYGEHLFRDRPRILLEVQTPEIGARIATLFRNREYTFFHIEESTGLRPVETPGGAGDDKNYLLCPTERITEFEPFRGV